MANSHSSLTSAQGSTPSVVDEAAGLWPREVAALYEFPGDMDGAGECVGIIALGGGYLPSDVHMATLGTGRPAPLIVDFPVDGIYNNFGGGDVVDEEIALDLQILAALVPAARIVVYFAKNSISSLTAAVRAATSDAVNCPSVLSISWGSAEKFWSDSNRQALDDTLRQASASNITVLAACGDLLATAGITDGAAHVLFPASSKYVLACGGTQVTLGDKPGVLGNETVWNEGMVGGGGGISEFVSIPRYQIAANLPKSVNDGGIRRGVPDVSAAAGSVPGYRVIVAGRSIVKQGTSAAAPLWASLIVEANRRRGRRLGLVHAFLYSMPSLFRQIIHGSNRLDGIGYDAGPGWNACTGLGAPRGAEIVDALAKVP